MVVGETQGGSVFSGSFALQKLTLEQKIEKYGSVEDYCVQMVLAIEGVFAAKITGVNRFHRKKLMDRNIKLLKENYFDVSDFASLVKKYGDGGEGDDYKFPVTLSHYDIIGTPINLLKGEEIARPFNYSVFNVSQDNVSTAEEKKTEMVLAIAQNFFLKEMKALEAKEGISVVKEPDEDSMPKDKKGNTIDSMEKLQRYMKYDYGDLSEKIANDILQYEKYNQELPDKFNQNFENFLLTGCEFFCVEDKNGDVNVRVLDPRLVDFENTVERYYVEDPAYLREIRYIPVSQAIDEYYDYLTEEDIDSLEKLTTGLGMGFYSSNVFEFNESFVNLWGNSAYCRVAEFEWKGLKRVGVLTRTTVLKETKEEIVEEEYVQEDYKVRKKYKDEDKNEVTESVRWFWVTERWRTTRIGQYVFTKMMVVENQYTSITQPFKSTSRYVGIRTDYSLADKLVEWQFLYNIGMYLFKLALARAKGKILLMDYAQLPKKAGWTPAKWLFYLDMFGIAMIDSTEVTEDGKRTNFNAFQMIDMSLGNQIQGFVEHLELVKREIESITGITRQRQGNITSSETLGGVERSISQSSAVTEVYFYQHNEVKKKVLQRVIDVAKTVYKKGKKVNFILDDVGRSFFEVDEGFKNGEYGVFVTNSGSEVKDLEVLREAAQLSLQSGEITLKDYFRVLMTKSRAEMKHILIEANEEAKARRDEQGSQQQALQQQQIDAQNQQLLAQQEFQKSMAQAEIDKDIQIQQMKWDMGVEIEELRAQAQITAFREDVDADVNDNGALDVVEEKKVQLMEKEMNINATLKNKELDIKKEDLAVKREQAKAKELEAKKKEADAKKTKK